MVFICCLVNGEPARNLQPVSNVCHNEVVSHCHFKLFLNVTGLPNVRKHGFKTPCFETIPRTVPFVPQNATKCQSVFRYNKHSMTVDVLQPGHVRVNVRVTIDTKHTSRCVMFVFKVKVGNQYSYSAIQMTPGQFMPVTLDEGFDVNANDTITVKGKGTEFIDRRSIYSILELEWRGQDVGS